MRQIRNSSSLEQLGIVYTDKKAQNSLAKATQFKERRNQQLLEKAKLIDKIRIKKSKKFAENRKDHKEYLAYKL